MGRFILHVWVIIEFLEVIKLFSVLESIALNNYVKELVNKTEIRVVGDKYIVKCPLCGDVIEFDVNMAKDGLALGLSLNNHLYYCLISQIPNPFLRNRIAHNWSVSVMWKLKEVIR
jgi:hypothetical protein